MGLSVRIPPGGDLVLSLKLTIFLIEGAVKFILMFVDGER